MINNGRVRSREAKRALDAVRSRLDATLAAMDEALGATSESKDDWLRLRLRSHVGESRDLVAVLEQEADALTRHVTEIRQSLEEERSLSAAWERRAMSAVHSQRQDLASQAVERHRQHQAQAEQLQAELEEYETSIGWYRSLIEEVGRA